MLNIKFILNIYKQLKLWFNENQEINVYTSMLISMSTHSHDI